MDGVSIAGSLVSIGAAGCQIAVKLYTLASQIITASERVSSISNDIFLTSGVLQQLGELLTQKTDTDGTTIFTQSSLDITKTSARICERIFEEVEKALKDASEQIRHRGRLVGKIKLSRSEKAKWPFAQPSIEALRNDLREAKGTLMLMLQVTSLAFSKKMANDHQISSTFIVEQRDSIHAILELSKQHNVMNRARVPVASSRNDSPEPASPTARAGINRTIDENLLPRQTAASRHDVALSIGPNFEVLERSPRVTFSQSQEVPTDERSPSADSRYRAPSAIQERCDQDEVVTKADCISNAGLRGGSISTPVEWNTDNCRGRKLLDFFILKPIIQDLVDVIQLSWRIHKIPMQQAEVQKQMVEAEHGGVLATFQLYQDLYAHEHKAIDHEIAKAGAGASLTSIKRTTANLWHRDIFFKGVPGLQFVLEHFPLLTMTVHGMPEKSGDQAQDFVSQPQKGTVLPMEPLICDPSEGQEDEMYEAIVPALEQLPTRARNSIELPYSPSSSIRDYRRAPSSNGTSSASSLHENRTTALGDDLSRMEGLIDLEGTPYLVSRSDITGEGAGEEISEELADTAEAHVGDDVELAIVHRPSDQTENGHSGGLEDTLEVTQHRTHLQQGGQLAQHSIMSDAQLNHDYTYTGSSFIKEPRSLLSGDCVRLTRASSALSSSSVPTSIGARHLDTLPLLEYDCENALAVPSYQRRQSAVLECPFNLLLCFVTFAASDQQEWTLHSLAHFGSVEPPRFNRCCLCDEVFVSYDGVTSWTDRMDHIYLHHSLGHGLAVARPDFQLYNYLWRHNVISDAVYQDIKGDGRQMDVLTLKDLLGDYTTLYNGPGSEGA